jgi:glutamate/tyrosine decarboxylase-like PLP-dependent enzyme
VEERRVLERAAALGIEYLESLDGRPVRPVASIEELRQAFDVPLPDAPTEPLEVIEQLARDADPGLTATGGGRYFGFVVGGAVPAALAADWLTAAWDQNAGLALLTPSASVAEEVAGKWLKELLRIPSDASFALVTGCQMAHATALVAARHHVLAAVGHDVEVEGLSGGPAIRIVAGAKRHGTVDRALRFVGLGTACVREVPADDQGRMVVDGLAGVLAESDAPTIVIAQIGEVNTGACDDLAAIADACEAAGAWLHVDGAFGLWAAASPSLRHLVAGSERADSWATDAHKWLNVPYDVGVAFCAHPDSHRAALGIRSAYLLHAADAEAGRDPLDWTPEHSRRGRGFSTYAALRSLGRGGVAELVETTCARARSLAAALAELPGCEILNEVVLNQVLFRFEDDEATDAFIAAVQSAGEAWLGGTLWDGRRAVRLSVSCWRTSEDDVLRAAAAFAAARDVTARV